MAEPDDAAHEGLIDYKMSRGDSAACRAAISAGPERVEAFWHGMADQLGFDLSSLVLGDVPAKGLIDFKARPLAPPESAKPAEVPAEQDAELAERESPNAEAQMEGTERRIDSAIDRFLATAEAGTLAGDLASAMLDIFQAIHKPWSAHSQQEKRDRVSSMEKASTQLVRGLVDLLAGEGRVSVKAILEKITIGDKTAIGLKLASLPHEEQASAIAQLFEWQKESVLIVSADASGFLSKRRELVEPDEIDLPFDQGDRPQAPAPEALPPPPPADDSDLADGAGPEADDSDEADQQEPEGAAELRKPSFGDGKIG